LLAQCKEVHFASILSGEFITAIVVNPSERKVEKCNSVQCTVVHFASFLSGGFITAIVVNQPERKLANCTSVQWPKTSFFIYILQLEYQLLLQMPKFSISLQFSGISHPFVACKFLSSTHSWS
jgi:hypothetical protein